MTSTNLLILLIPVTIRGLVTSVWYTTVLSIFGANGWFVVCINVGVDLLIII